MRNSEISKTTGFGDIETVILYKKPSIEEDGRSYYKFFPTLDPEDEHYNDLLQEVQAQKEQYKCHRILYHGSNKNIMETDFAEYDFSYLFDKYKYNNLYNISKLDNTGKSMIGKGISDLSIMESALFPTTSSVLDDEEEDIGYDYFGTILISNQLLFFLNVPKGVAKIEFYSGVITKNVNDGEEFYDYDWLKAFEPERRVVLASSGDEVKYLEPVVSVYLGPEPGCRNNDPGEYYTNDPMRKNRLGKYVPALEHSKLQDEVTKDKVVWVILSNKSDRIDSLNLAYEAWYNNDNANRNKPLYTLRNDEYWSSIKNIDIVEELEETDIARDQRSSYLLGNQPAEEFTKTGTKYENRNYPILSRKLSKSEAGNGIYSPVVKYKEGDIITFGESSWISISNNNLGNRPGLSNTWIESGKINNYYTTQVKILCQYYTDDLGWVTGVCGYVKGMTTIPVRGNNDSVTITVVANSGYSPYTGGIKSYKALALPDGTDIQPLIKDGSGEWEKIYTITNWEPILSQPEPTLVLRFEQIQSRCIFRAKLGNEIFNYGLWENNIYDEDVYGNLGKLRYLQAEFDKPIIISSDNEGSYFISPGQRKKFEFTKLDTYDLKSIDVSYTGEKKGKKVLQEGKTRYTFTDYINYREVTYTLNFENSKKTVSVINSEDYEISLAKEEFEYAEEIEVRFYQRDSGQQFSGIYIRLKEDPENVNVLVKDQGRTYSFPDMPESITLSISSDGIYSVVIKKLIKNIIIDFKV